MSKISDIYDAIANVVEGTLTNYVRLPNAYQVEKNTYLQLKKGYALSISSGSNTQRYVDCLTTWERSFTLTIINQVTTTQNNLASRELLEKSILDDHELVLKAFENDPSLSGTAIKSILLTDGGVNYIDAELTKFFTIDLEITTEYQFDPRA